MIVITEVLEKHMSTVSELEQLLEKQAKLQEVHVAYDIERFTKWIQYLPHLIYLLAAWLLWLILKLFDFAKVIINLLANMVPETLQDTALSALDTTTFRFALGLIFFIIVIAYIHTMDDYSSFFVEKLKAFHKAKYDILYQQQKTQMLQKNKAELEDIKRKADQLYKTIIDDLMLPKRYIHREAFEFFMECIRLEEALSLLQCIKLYEEYKHRQEISSKMAYLVRLLADRG